MACADRACVNKARKEEAEERGLKWRMSRKATEKAEAQLRGQVFKRKCNRMRARLEHAFAVIKNLWGCRRVRCRRLAKKAWQVDMLWALPNICMTRKP